MARVSSLRLLRPLTNCCRTVAVPDMLAAGMQLSVDLSVIQTCHIRNNCVIVTVETKVKKHFDVQDKQCCLRLYFGKNKLLKLPGNKKHSIENIFDIQCPFMENIFAIIL